MVDYLRVPVFIKLCCGQHHMLPMGDSIFNVEMYVSYVTVSSLWVKISA